METQDGKKPRVKEKKIHYVEDDYKRESAAMSKHYIYSVQTIKKKKKKRGPIPLLPPLIPNFFHNFTFITKCCTASFQAEPNKIRVTISNNCNNKEIKLKKPKDNDKRLLS